MELFKSVNKVIPLLFVILANSGCGSIGNQAPDEWPSPDDYYTKKFRDDKLQAIAGLTKILNSGRNDVLDACQRRRGDLYVRINRYDEGLQDLKRDPHLDWDLVSITEEALSEPEAALEHAEKAIQFSKKTACSFQDVRAKRATLAALLGQPDLAINDLDSLFKSGFESEHNRYRNLKAFALMEKGEYQPARTLIAQVLENEPRNRTAYYLGCRLNLETHQPEKALSSAHDQISLISHSVDRYATPMEACNFQQRAMVYAALKKPERVFADLHMADLILRRNSVPQSVSAECAGILAAAGDMKSARELIKQERERLSRLTCSLDNLEKRLH